MKVAVIQDKLSDNKLTNEKFAKQIISPVEEDYPVSSLDTLAMAEFVKQRRIDALRIKELTLRAIEAMEKPNNNIDIFCEKSAVNGVRD